MRIGSEFRLKKLIHRGLPPNSLVFVRHEKTHPLCRFAACIEYSYNFFDPNVYNVQCDFHQHRLIDISRMQMTSIHAHGMLSKYAHT